MADSALQRQHDRAHGGRRGTLVYDAENRLQQVKQGSTVLASYTYDADGNRVKAVMGSSKLGGFLPRIARIDTKAEARFVQISEIRGRENWADFCHELHELTRRQKLDSCKLVKFVAEKAGRILATNYTKAEAQFVQISEIRGRESGAHGGRRDLHAGL